MSLFIGSVLFSGCGGPHDKPANGPTPSHAPTNSPIATKTGVSSSSMTSSGNGSGEGSGSGSGGNSSGSGVSQPAAPVGAPPEPDPPKTRAEIEQNFERDSKNFPSEPSLNRNPSEARAQASPRTIEVVAGLNGYEEVMGKSQPSRSFEAVEAGKRLYKANCARCHSMTGEPTEVAGQTLSRYAMADLSQPMRFKYGADGRGIFRSIAFGTAAPPHGMYNGVLKDQQIWNIVAYVQSLQKARR